MGIGAGDSTSQLQNLDKQGIEKAEKINKAAAPPPPPPDNRGNSDFHLKHVDDLLDQMSETNLGEIFIAWRECSGAAHQFPPPKYRAAGSGKEEKELLEELRHIDWGQMKDAAARLEHLVGKADPLVGDVKSLEGRIDGEWQGRAADAARQKYHDMIAPLRDYCDSSRKFAEEMRKAATVPEAAIYRDDNIFSNPKHNSGVWKNYGQMKGNIDGVLKDLEGLKEYTRTAKYEVGIADAQNPSNAFLSAIQRRALEALGRANGMTAQQVLHYNTNSGAGVQGMSRTGGINNGTVKIRLEWSDLRLHGSPPSRGEDTDTTLAHERIKWLDDFAGWYAHDIDFLRRRIGDAHENIGDAWFSLTTAMEALEDNPFGNGQPGETSSDPENPAEPQANAAGSAPGAGFGPVGAGGSVGAGGGGGTASVPAGAMPQPPSAPQMPQSPQMPQPPQGPQSPETPGGPGAGEAEQPTEDDTAPEAQQAPQPDMFLPEQSEGEQVTIGQGEDRIAINEPDENGNVSLTLMGENGPEVYEISFEQQPIDAPDQAAGPQTLPGQVAGQPVPGDPAGDGSWMEASASGQETPQSPAFQPDTGAVPVSAGPDGQATIELADRTITVEQAQAGGLQVTVDSGDGSPQEYTVDFGPDQESGTAPPYTGAMPFEQPEPAAFAASDDMGSDQPIGAQPTEARSSGTQFSETQPSGESAGAQSAGAQPAGTESAASSRFFSDDIAGEPSTGQPGLVDAPTGDAGTPEFGTATGAPSTEDLPASTTLQWDSGFSSLSTFAGDGMQSSFGSASGTLVGDGGGSFLAGGSSNVWGQTLTSEGAGLAAGVGAAGLASMDEARNSSSQGATGLASMGESSGDGSSNEQGSAMRGGMMPMGGMGAGGQDGGEEERSNDSPWRTQGDLFDDGIDPDGEWRYRAVLGDDERK